MLQLRPVWDSHVSAVRSFAFGCARILPLILLTLCAESLCAQPDNLPEAWTLEQCISYAETHSLDIQGQSLQELSSRAQLREAKWAFAPSVSANATHAYDFGRAIDYGSNTVSNDLQSTSFSVGASVTLFDGFANVRSVQLRRLEVEGQLAHRAVILANLSLGVAKAFLQVVYQQELLQTRADQLAINEKQLELGVKRAAAGAITQGAVLELQAQVATAQQAQVTAENALAQAKIQLIQALNLQGVSDIQLVRPMLDSASLPQMPVANVDQIYQQALLAYPTIVEAELAERQAAKQVQIAQGRHYPVLSLSASYGSATRYYLNEANHLPADPFMTQVRNNAAKRLQLSLTIPIFDRFSAHTGVTRAKIGQQQAALARKQAENTLYRNVQTAYQDALSGFRQLEAARRNVASLDVAFQWAETKLAVGAISTYDFAQAQSRLSQARVTLLQATIDYLFKVKILEFYQGTPFKF